MFDGMTDKHINFDLSKTDNMAADVGCLNDRNILCNFGVCNTVIVPVGGAIKTMHNVSERASATTGYCRGGAGPRPQVYDRFETCISITD